MRSKWVAIPALLLALGGDLHGMTRTFGLGLIAGEPTGLSAKKWLSEDSAFDLAAAWSFVDNDAFQFHADYLRHDFSLIRPEGMKGRLPVYYGIGARIKLRSDENTMVGVPDNDEVRVGVRIPLGISFLPPTAPVDVFLEMVPVLDLAPETDLLLNAAIGGRYYF